MEKKTCSCCLIEKEKDQFLNKTFGSMSFQTVCIECVRANKHRKARNITSKKELHNWASAIVGGLNGYDY